jgi:hypothetical protein
VAFVTRKDFSADDLHGFAAQVTTNAKKMKYGSGAGIGSANRLVCKLLHETGVVHQLRFPVRTGRARRTSGLPYDRSGSVDLYQSFARRRLTE